MKYSESSTPVGEIIKIIGYAIIAVGVVVGLIALTGSNEWYFIFSSLGIPLLGIKFIVCLIFAVSGFITGMIFVGIGEAINLLYNINEKLKTYIPWQLEEISENISVLKKEEEKKEILGSINNEEESEYLGGDKE